jgi:transcriptional regulator with XRE-family HTH domain
LETAAPRAIVVGTASTDQPIGHLLREWRQRRRLSQLDLALEAEVSTRHLSFLETGRSTPSREMVLHLAERLEVPRRERNTLLLAAGYAPAFVERPFDDPALADARRAVETLLAAHEPCPALAVDRHWNLLAANRALAPLLGGIDPSLLKPPLNVLRLSLHPAGLAPRLVNHAEWRAHLFARLERQLTLTADSTLRALLDELRGYPAPSAPPASPPDSPLASVIVPMRLATEAGILSFVSTTTVFGTPVKITLSELALETLFPADAFTAEALGKLAESWRAAPAAAR